MALRPFVLPAIVKAFSNNGIARYFPLAFLPLLSMKESSRMDDNRS